MLTFKEKREISQRIAGPAHIETYRKLLSGFGDNSASRICIDRQKLACELVYALLSYMNEVEIVAATFDKPCNVVQSEPLSKAAKIEDKKLSKFEEYPNIKWRCMDDERVRTADAIFTDRINLYMRLKELEPELYDAEVDFENVHEFAEAAIRMELCFAELSAFNNKKEFLGKHPFIGQRSERDELRRLLLDNPREYVKRIHNIEMNITRYSSHLKSDKFSEERKRQEEQNLHRHQELLELYIEILTSEIKRYD